MAELTTRWRMINPRMPERWTISLGESAEKLAVIHDISREEQDAYAVRSHRLATQAWDDGVLREVVPVPGVELDRDEGIRPDTDGDKPAFVEGGTVTAGTTWDDVDVVERGEPLHRRGPRPRRRPRRMRLT